MAGREPQITKFMENIGSTNVVEGWSRKTLVKPTFSKNPWFSNHVAASSKFMENIGFTIFFEGWSRKTSVKPVLSKTFMLFKPCGWEHEIHR